MAIRTGQECKIGDVEVVEVTVIETDSNSRHVAWDAFCGTCGEFLGCRLPMQEAVDLATVHGHTS